MYITWAYQDASGYRQLPRHAGQALQIPRRDGHPCSWLMVGYTTYPITDLHRQVIRHARRTKKGEALNAASP